MTLKKSFFALIILSATVAVAPGQTVELTENFTSATQTTGGWTLTSGVWPAQNNSDNPQPYSANGGAWGPGGTLFNPAPGSGYFATDTTATGNANGTVSDWLLTPVLSLHNGDTLTFETRTRSPEEGPSSLYVRLSTAGSGTNVGTTSGAVGTFTTLVGAINPNVTAGAYPESWTTETFTISGLSGTASGRIAFQTFYPNGGFGGPNGDTVGLATVTYTTVPQTISTWTGNINGSWNTSGNWSPVTIPSSSVNTQLTFGTTTNGAMTNDIPGTFSLNSMTFNAGSPVYSLSGSNGLNFGTNSSSALPTIVSNSSNSVTISVPVTLTNNLTVSGSGNVALNGAIGGAGSVTMSGPGILTLGNTTNSFSGGVNITNGTVAIPADGALGSGPLTIAVIGTLDYTGTTSTARSFALNGATLAVNAGATVTLNGGIVTNGYLDGAGTFATNSTNAVVFDNVTATPSVAITSNNAKDQFVHFDNSAALTVAAGVNSSGAGTTVNLNGFTNEGLGSITLGAGSRLNVANFQSYGTLTLTPNTTSAPTVFTNTGNSPLGFNGGSRTFIGTPGTADPTGQNVLAYIDLHGQNAVVTGGLFVNNGGVFDTSAAGTATVIADFGSLVKGSGFYQNTVKTQNGGKFQTGNCPGSSQFGFLVLGPGGIQNFNWQINDATGAAGPGDGLAAGTPVSGWSVMHAVSIVPPLGHTISTGNMTWTATSTPGNQFQIALETLLNPTPIGTDNPGVMDNFDPTQPYVWPFVTYAGTFSGPTDSATLTKDTAFDTSVFMNAYQGSFSIQLDPLSKELDVVYTPGGSGPASIPEPGTLGLVAAGLLGVWRCRRRGNPIESQTVRS